MHVTYLNETKGNRRATIELSTLRLPTGGYPLAIRHSARPCRTGAEFYRFLADSFGRVVTFLEGANRHMISL